MGGRIPAPSSTSPSEVILYDPTEGARARSDVIYKLDETEQSSVLRSLFPKYRKKCASSERSVLAKADGSFTAARAVQTLYLVWIGECGATHAENFGSNVIAVVQDGSVISRITIDGGSSIGGLFDLDDDGRHEVLLESGFTNQGSTVSVAKFVRVASDTLETIVDFGQTYEDNCGSGTEPLQQQFSVIYATPGSPPTFRKQPMTRPCK